jgi:tetratricopeptide (TPR) repeat protein
MTLPSQRIAAAAMLALAALCCALPSSAQAVDRVKLLQGSQQNGDIKSSTATELALEIGATKKQIAVNEIDLVQFEAEPTQLTQARAAIRGGRYAEAAAALDKIVLAEIKRPLIAEDVKFYEALANARLALGGTGAIAEAGKKMLSFEKAHPDSFHHFEACEVVGDLLVAMGNYTVADTYYGKLALAPWPEFRLRAKVLSGRALVGQSKFKDAIVKFDEVLAIKDTGKEADAQRVAALLGKASALGGEGNEAEAVKLIDEVIAKAAPEDEELHARAYNLMGHCYMMTGKRKQAILAYLHTDLLYSRFAPLHAEALGNLAELFTADQKTERAAQARALLKEKYPSSAWANK